MSISLKSAIAATLAAPQCTFYYQGPPGVGKTYGAAAELRAAGYDVKIVSCQNLPIEDTAQLPKIDGDSYKFLSNKMWEPKPKQAFILDELPKAPEDVFNAFNGFLYGKPRTFMGYYYPEDTIVIVTGNHSQFRAGDKFKPHHVNRVVCLDIAEPVLDEARRVMLNLGYDSRIISWVDNVPSALNSYDPSVQAKPENEISHYFGFLERNPKSPYCSMRSLETASRLISRLPTGEALASCLEGTIGKRASMSLFQFLRELGEFVPLAEILKDPTNTRVPKKVFDQRLAALTCASALDKTTWSAVSKYVPRLDANCQRVFWLAVSQKTLSTELYSSPAFNSALKKANLL
jgi:hypothetical protein